MNNPTIIGSATLYQMDCMELLANTPDKFYDLAIVDPPYGINQGNAKPMSKTSKQDHLMKDWDLERPTNEYFIELKRVSKNQIIWGANYYPEFLTASMGWIFWDKDNHKFTLSDGELAYSSFNKKLTVFKRFANLDRGFLAKDGHIHPTQKPIKLYEWLLKNYAKQGDKILDTHLGSMSSVIAALNMGFEITGCELDVDYFNAGVARVKQSQAQDKLFAPIPPAIKPVQELLYD